VVHHIKRFAKVNENSMDSFCAMCSVCRCFLRILCTFYLSTYVLPPVLFTLTQVVLLLITSAFTRTQIQSNLVGTIAN
jgi:hypothetical protein